MANPSILGSPGQSWQGATGPSIDNTITAFPTPAGSNRILLVFASTYADPGTLVSTTCSYGGVPMTLLDSDTTAAYAVYGITAVYYLKEASIPAGASNNVVFRHNFSASTGYSVGIAAQFFQDVNQTTPFGPVVKHTGALTTASRSVTISAAVGDLLLTMLADYKTTTATGGQTKIVETTAPADDMLATLGSMTATATSTALGYTFASNENALLGTSLRAVSAGGGQTATKVAITTQPSGAANGVVFTTQPVVQIQDSGSTQVTGATDSVTVAIASGTGTLSGTTTVAAVNGIATFTNLKITGTGAHTLIFTSGTLASATSNSLTVTVVPTKLAVTTQPSGAVSGTNFSTQPVIQIQDAGSTQVAGATNAVTAAIASGTGTLSGTTTVAAVNGVATFTNLKITGTGAHTLTFTSAGLTPVTSSSVTVTSPTPTKLAITTQPSGASSGVAFTTQPVVQVQDVSSALVSTDTSTVYAMVGAGTGILTGTTSKAAVGGVATFTDLKLTGPGVHSLRFSTHSPVIASHDFNDGTFGPYTNDGSGDVDIVDDPTGAGRGKVARLHYAGTAQDRNRNFFIQFPTGLGQNLFFKGDFFIPGTASTDGAHIARKLYYWQSQNWPNNPEFWSVCGMYGNEIGNDNTYVLQSGGADYTNNPIGKPSINGQLPGLYTTGVWHTLETQVNLGSALGAADGCFRQWLDGVLLYEEPHKIWTDAAWGVAPSTVYFYTYSVGDQVNGTDANPYDEYRYWDNVTFSRQRVGT